MHRAMSAKNLFEMSETMTPMVLRLATAQGAGGVVGLVIEFLRDLQNALGRFLVHAVGLLAVGLVVHH